MNLLRNVSRVFRSLQPLTRPVRRVRRPVLAVEELESRLAPSTLPITFQVPGLLANKGVYVGIFGQLQNGTAGYGSVVPYTPAVGPSAGQPLNGNDWVYLTSAGGATTTLGASTPLTASVYPGGNSVASVTVPQGQGGTYTSAPTVSFSGGGGTGATGTVVYSSSQQTVTGVNVTSGGNYSSPPTVNFTPTGGVGYANMGIQISVANGETALFPSSGTVVISAPNYAPIALSYTSTTTGAGGAFDTFNGVQFVNPAQATAFVFGGSNPAWVVAEVNVPLSGSTLPVAATANFPSSGSLMIESAGQNQVLYYTGTTTTSFTGVTGGTGGMPGGATVVAGSVAAATTLANSVTLPATSIVVASGGTAGFPSAGSLTIIDPTLVLATQLVSYTGISGNTFTGVTGLTSMFQSGATVAQAMDYALAPPGQNLPLINLFPNPGTYPQTNATVTATFYIPDQMVAPITSGQIVISVGSAMAIPVAVAGTVASPDVGTNPNDKFGLFEWGWDSQGGVTPTGVLDIDISEVDQVGFPFKVTTSPAMPPPAQDGTGLSQGRDTLFNGFTPYIQGLGAASNASVFLEGAPENNLTTFPTGTRITAPQDIVEKLELNGPALTGSVVVGTGLPVDKAGNVGIYYVVSAVSANGESMGSTKLALLPTTANAMASLSWDAYPYATGYKVYRGTATGFTGSVLSYGSLSLMTLTTLSASTLTYSDSAALPPTLQPANPNPPANNYNYDPLNQYFTTALVDFFNNYTTANSFVLDHMATSTTWVGNTTSLTISGNTYTVLQLAGQSGQYGGLYAGYTLNIYEPFFSSNTDQDIPSISVYSPAPSWLPTPTESPSSMLFGCDGVFDTPDNIGLSTAPLAASSLDFSSSPTTLTVATGASAGFAQGGGALLIAGPGNTNQVVSYTSLTPGTDTFNGITSVSGTFSGTFTSATVYALAATTPQQTTNLTLPLPTTNAVLPASTTGFPGAGNLTISGAGNTNQSVSYTGTTPGSFTGVTGGTGAFTNYTASATLAPSSISTAPTAVVKDVMNSIASAFNRGIATDFSLAPTYWASDPNPLVGAAIASASVPGSLPAQTLPPVPITLSGPYYYAITAVNVNGDTSGAESTPSNFAKVVVGSNQAVHLSWSPLNLPGGAIGATTAESFNIYRGDSPDNLKLITNVQNGNPSPTPTSDFYDTGYVDGTVAPPHTYYAAGSTANFYSAYFHRHEVGINGLAYGFPYDDQGGFSTNVQMATPDSVTISLLPWTSTTQLVVSGVPASTTAGTAITTFTVTAQKNSGATDTNYAGTVHFSSSDTQAVLPADYTFQASDNGTHTFNTFGVTLNTAGAQTVTVTDNANDLTVATPSITVNAGVAAHLAFVHPSLYTFLGSPLPTVTVQVQDAHNNVVTSVNTGTVALGLGTSPIGGTLSGTKTANIINGVASFAGLTPNKIGGHALSATSGVLTTVVSNPFNVSATTAFSISGPASVQAGQSFQVTVKALAAGKVDPLYHGRVHFSSSDLAQVLPADYTFTPADAGQHTFTVTLGKAGSRTLTVTDTRKSTVTLIKSFTVVAGPTVGFSVTGYPAFVYADTAKPFTVTAVDAFGNKVTTFQGIVTLNSSDPLAVGVAPLPVAFNGAQVMFTKANAGSRTFWVKLGTTGALQSLAAAAGSLTGSQTGINVYKLAASIAPANGVAFQPLSFTFGAVQGTAPANTFLSYTINWGDFTAQTISGAGLINITVSHAYTTTGNKAITLKVTDAQFHSSPRSANVNITPTNMDTDPANPGNTALFVGGTPGNDTIVIRPAGTKLIVDLSTGGPVTSFGPFSFTGNVYVYGGAGNDTITLQPGVAVPAIIDGGAGNDTINAKGSQAGNVLLGGLGNDILFGGIGGIARDLLIGGLGADSLHAGTGGAILIGGTTVYDANVAALAAVLAEWSSPGAYATRVNNLLGLSTGLNAPFTLTLATVKSDTSVDSLFGGAGLDWFFLTGNGTLDLFNSFINGEEATIL